MAEKGKRLELRALTNKPIEIPVTHNTNECASTFAKICKDAALLKQIRVVSASDVFHFLESAEASLLAKNVKSSDADSRIKREATQLTIAMSGEESVELIIFYTALTWESFKRLYETHSDEILLLYHCNNATTQIMISSNSNLTFA